MTDNEFDKKGRCSPLTFSSIILCRDRDEKKKHGLHFSRRISFQMYRPPSRENMDFSNFCTFFPFSLCFENKRDRFIQGQYLRFFLLPLKRILDRPPRSDCKNSATIFACSCRDACSYPTK